MNPVTFKQALCQQHNLDPDKYHQFVMKRSLFFRVRLIRPLINFLNAGYLFNENRLVEKVGLATTLKEIQDEIDFYQHKYVVTFMMKDALRFRLSGMRLMRLANSAFRHARDNNVTSKHGEPSRHSITG